MSKANWCNINNNKLCCCKSTLSRILFDENLCFLFSIGSIFAKFEHISQVLVPGLPADTNTRRLGGGLEENQEPGWDEAAALTAVPWRQARARFDFSHWCPPNDGTGKTPESSNHGARREATIWLDRLRRTLTWSRSTKLRHKMKKEKPCLRNQENYSNFEGLKLCPVIYFCLNQGCLWTSYYEMHPIFLSLCFAPG